MARNWAEIPTDVAAKIAEHIELYDDYESFSKVCADWRFAIKKTPGHKYTNKYNTQLPWLMLADPDDAPYRRFYSLTKRMYVKIDLPTSVLGTDPDDQTRRYFSSRGWLISVSQKNRRVALFNPVSGTVIEPPTVPIELIAAMTDGEWEDWMLVEHFAKFVLSATPSNSGNNDYSVAMICECTQSIAFWRPGQDTWVELNPLCSYGCCHDLCFFQGKFYTINSSGEVRAIQGLDDQNMQPSTDKVIVDLESLGLISIFDFDKLYLVESERRGCLLVVHRITLSTEEDSLSTEEDRYTTESFRVFKVNVENGEVQELRSLGNRAIFVGFNSTFSVMASDNGCQADCIYYTDDNCEVYAVNENAPNGGGEDMGIYDFALGKLIHYQHLHSYDGPSRFSFISPPMWIEFTEYNSLNFTQN